MQYETRVVTIPGGRKTRRIHLAPAGVVRERVLQHLRKHRLSKNVPVNQHLIRLDRNWWLLRQLLGYSYELEQKRNTSTALKALGFTVTHHFSLEEVRRHILDAVPRSLVESAYKGVLPATFGIKDHIRRHGSLSWQAYRACFNKARTNRVSLEDVLNEAYPDLAEKYRDPVSGELVKPYDAFHRPPLSPEEIQQRVRTWFYAGEDLFLHGMYNLPDGARTYHTIERHRAPGEHPRLRPREHRSSVSFTRKLCEYLALPDLKPEHLFDKSWSGVKLLSLVGERQLLFLLAAVARYDPQLQHMGAEFASYFPAPLVRVYTPRENHLSVHNRQHSGEADARLLAGGGTRDVLVEAKIRKRLLLRSVREEMVDKYRGKLWWRDKSLVTDRVAFLNASNGDLQEATTLLEQNGWRVLDGHRFMDFYEKGLELLLHHEPDFFVTAPVPLTDPQLLLEANSLVFDKPHLLLPKTHQFYNQWLARFLDENLEALVSGQRREPFSFPAQTCQTPFSHFAPSYGKRAHVDFPGVLLVDLETRGFRNSGSPIVVLGVAHSSPQGMVVEQYLVRNPAEEKGALLWFAEKTKEYHTLVTFNGDSFDVGLLRERFYAHRLPFPDHFSHIDMYHAFRRYAQDRGLPHARLQTYERVEFGLKRRGDVPGSQIPAVYDAFLYREHHAHRIDGVLGHNQSDLVTLTLLYDQLRHYRGRSNMGEKR